MPLPTATTEQNVQALLGFFWVVFGDTFNVKTYAFPTKARNPPPLSGGELQTNPSLPRTPSPLMNNYRRSVQRTGAPPVIHLSRLLPLPVATACSSCLVDGWKQNGHEQFHWLCMACLKTQCFWRHDDTAVPPCCQWSLSLVASFP